jgi:hypothetical protein
LFARKDMELPTWLTFDKKVSNHNVNSLAWCNCDHYNTSVYDILRCSML